jgi:hypothetical protein
VTLTDASTHIAVVLMGLASGVAVIAALVATRGRRYPAVPYATFHPGGSRVLLTDCEGRCSGATAHETDGAGTATCVTCGTPRTGLAPDEA